jgi:hypothetical protein
VFVVSLAFYVATMCRTVFWWDSGELAANAYVLGIAHRPGFPLYILLGHVFGLIPFGDYFYRINFISAVSAGTSLSILGYLWMRISSEHARRAEVGTHILVGTLALAALGGTYSYWMQAVRAEVYAPTLLALTLVLACCWRADCEIRNRTGHSAQWFGAAAFLIGLGTGLHHATFLSVLPAVILFFIWRPRRFRLRASAWLTGAVLALLGLTIYLYLPIRASQNPPLNWGWVPGVVSPAWSAVAATDSYSYIGQTTVAGMLGKFADIGGLLLGQLQWGLIVIAATGAAWFWFKQRKWLIFAGVTGLTNVVITAILVTDFNETNADIHGYLLPALAAIALLTAGGLLSLLTILRRMSERWLPTPLARHIIRVAAIVMITLVGIAPGIIFAPFCNLTSNRLAYDFGSESIRDLQPDAIVFLAGTNWDFVLRGIRYVENRRPDLIVINRDLLPSAWYRHWLALNHPDLHPQDIPVDSEHLKVREWARMLAEEERTVYWEFTETDVALIDWLVPAGHLFELSNRPIDALGPDLLDQQRAFEERSRFYGSPERVLYDNDAKMVWVLNLYRAGMYYERRGLLGRAKELYQKALSVEPSDDSLRVACRRVTPSHRLPAQIHSLNIP